MYDDNNNSKNNVNFHIITNDSEMESFLDYLPPEIQNLIKRDITRGGSNNIENNINDDIPTSKEKIKYDYKMVNCNQDLKELVSKLKKSKYTNYGILLYGVSGSGKSYFGQYLAQELNMPFIKKRASDMVAKFVGETERNIAQAFAEARKKKAVLLLDEADSFLFDRKFADRDFEAMHVNELLTQMEDHPYPFIMTTNLKEKIDPASMRRFIFKIKFDYMTIDNIKAGLKTYFGKGIKFTKDEYLNLNYLTAGDFKVVKRKLDILEAGNYTSANVYKYLLREQNEKELDKSSNSINF